MSQKRSKPTSLIRRAERAFIGAIMSVVALVLEKLVTRSMKKGGKVQTRP